MNDEFDIVNQLLDNEKPKINITPKPEVKLTPKPYTFKYQKTKYESWAILTNFFFKITQWLGRKRGRLCWTEQANGLQR